MQLTRWILLSLLLNSFGAIAAESTKIAIGAELLKPYKQQLKLTLQSGMQEGPLETIDICRVKAPEIAMAQTTETMRMGRSSHKLRNPANAPEPWMQTLLDNYLDSPSNQQPIAVQLDDGSTGYVEPILLQPMCLICHGENLSPEIVAQLREQYPDDQATGFAVGDLRGIFWVTFR